MNKLVIKILCFCILFNSFLSVTLNSVYAAKVLTEDSKKETVMECLENYTREILTEIETVMECLENYTREILTKIIYITSFISVIRVIEIGFMIKNLIVEERRELGRIPNMFLPRGGFERINQQGMNIQR